MPDHAEAYDPGGLWKKIAEFARVVGKEIVERVLIDQGVARRPAGRPYELCLVLGSPTLDPADRERLTCSCRTRRGGHSRLTEAELLTAMEPTVAATESLRLSATIGSIHLSWSNTPDEIARQISRRLFRLRDVQRSRTESGAAGGSRSGGRATVPVLRDCIAASGSVARSANLERDAGHAEPLAGYVVTARPLDVLGADRRVRRGEALRWRIVADQPLRIGQVVAGTAARCRVQPTGRNARQCLATHRRCVASGG